MHALNGGNGNQVKQRVSLMELVTLIQNVIVGAQTTEVGFEDARETVESLTRKLNGFTMIETSVLESALWSCNLLNENQKFWDTKGRDFDSFLKDLLGNARRFDKTYNLIKDLK
jgi:hypothetical protein